MAPDPSDPKNPLECCLQEGLSALAGVVREVGAHRVSVVLAEDRESVRLVYHWPDSPAAPTEFPVASGEASVTEPCDGPVPAESRMGQFLNQASPAASCFVLVPWPDRRWKVAIAFGFSSRQPATLEISRETSSTLRLAALATWIASEVRKLRRELHVVSDRLGRRKLVERAKGMLQVRHGWSEQQAYEHLRKLSRQRRKSMADTAQEILRGPPGT
jgi:ANTAR domain-containing protein